LRHLFQWSDDEEASGYAALATISSVRTGFVSANMANSDNEVDLRCFMEAQEQTFKAQQKPCKTSNIC